MMNDKAILVVYEDDKWELVEEGDIKNLSEKDFSTIHFSKMDGEMIARIAAKYFPKAECNAMALTGLFLGISLQESFYLFLKMKQRK